MTADILTRLDDKAMRFLLSLHDGKPDLEAIGLPQAADMPAVRWKILNLEKLKAQNPKNHAKHRREIEGLRSIWLGSIPRSTSSNRVFSAIMQPQRH